MTETDSEDWHTRLQQLPYLVNLTVHRRGIARTVGKENSVGVEGHSLRAGSRSRHDRRATSELGQFSQGVSFHSKVETNDVKSLIAICRNLVRLLRCDNACEFTVFHHRRLTRLVDQALLVEVNS